jgi:hypothetical protein
MMRNLGGAIGTAAIETFFTKREQFHSAMVTPEVSLLEPATRNRLTDLQQYFMSHSFPDSATAMHRATVAVGDTIRPGDDNGLRRLLRIARCRAARRCVIDCVAEKGRRVRRRRALVRGACC